MVSKRRKVLLRFLAAAAGIVCCVIADSMDIFMSALLYGGTGNDVHYYWLNSIIFGGVYGSSLIYVFAALPLGDSFCCEYKNDIWRYIIPREGTFHYAARNLMKCFVSGAVTLGTGSFLLIVFLHRHMPLFMPERFVEVQTFPFADLLKNNPTRYFEAVIILLMLYGGLCASCAYTVSVYVPIDFLTLMSPFLVTFFVNRLSVALHVPSKLDIINVLTARDGPEKGYFLYAAAVVAGVWSFMLYLTYRRIRRRIRYD